MPATLKQVRKLEGEHVRMMFDDGREELALLLCATKDMDGSEHLIYEPVERVGEGRIDAPGEGEAAAPCVHANARTLLSIEPVVLPKSA